MHAAKSVPFCSATLFGLLAQFFERVHLGVHSLAPATAASEWFISRERTTTTRLVQNERCIFRASSKKKTTFVLLSKKRDADREADQGDDGAAARPGD